MYIYINTYKFVQCIKYDSEIMNHDAAMQLDCVTVNCKNEYLCHSIHWISKHVNLLRLAAFFKQIIIKYN